MNQAAAALLTLFAANTWAEPEEAKASGPSAVGLTVYNGNFALVREERNLDLGEGMNWVRVEGVAAQIDPTSVSLLSLGDPEGVAVREQNFQFDLINQDNILNRSVGKKVQVFGPDNAFVEGILLSPATVTLPPQLQPNNPYYNPGPRIERPGIILQTERGIRINPPGSVLVEELPKGLIPTPSLLWKLEASRSGPQRVRISYLTESVNWLCDYIAVANDSDTAVDLTGWVTLTNLCGTGYQDASLQLIAGDVRRVKPGADLDEGGMYAMESRRAKAAPQFQEEGFFEYHLYTLQSKTTIAHNETKQLSLLSAAAVPVRKVLVYDAGRAAYFNWFRRRGGFRPGEGQDTIKDAKVAVMLELKNSLENRLGMPLPKGKVRVYKADREGREQFLGEDEIDHTPRDEKLRLWVGDAFDLVGERARKDYKMLSPSLWEETIEIELRNHKDAAAELEVVERLIGDWQVLTKSHEFQKTDAHTILFPVKIEPHGSAKIAYRVRIRT